MEIIHIVLGKANPERMNGVNKVVYELATRQAASGANVSIWGITRNPVVNYGERNFKTRLFRKNRNPFFTDEVLLEQLLTKKGKAVFHIHGGWIPEFAGIAKHLSENAIPFVFTPHGAYNTIAMQRNKLVKQIYFSLFEKKMLQRASKIHCLGESEILGIKKMFEGVDTCLLPYGFEPQATNIAENGPQDDFIVGFVGRIDIYTKGLDLLLQAFEKFNARIPSSKLWIIGDGKEKQELEKIVAGRNLAQSVILFGGKFNEEKTGLMRQMDVFVHPSRNEGLPAAILEAAAMGLPSIVSKATNMAEHVQRFKAGISISNENAKELEEALYNIYLARTNSHHAEMQQNAQRMVKKAFNWDTLIIEFHKLYQNALRANTAHVYAA
jgi:glycosyltransferase involved in cell wall biosynthesis